MTIHPETYYRATELTKLIPGRPSLRCILRWLSKGSRRQGRIPSQLVGGRRVILGADLLAWINRGKDPALEQPTISRTPAERQRAANKAIAQLQRKGWL